MDKNYLYKYYQLKAKADYHLTMDKVLTSQISNEPDPMARKRLFARRSSHRSLYRKYTAKSDNVWTNMG